MASPSVAPKPPAPTPKSAAPAPRSDGPKASPAEPKSVAAPLPVYARPDAALAPSAPAAHDGTPAGQGIAPHGQVAAIGPDVAPAGPAVAPIGSTIASAAVAAALPLTPAADSTTSAAPAAAPKTATSDATAPSPASAGAGAEPGAGPAAGSGARNAAGDPAFQRVASKVRGVAAKQRRHAPAAAKVAQAHAAAVGPPDEVASRAADRQVQEMDRQEPRPFDRAKFKAALLKKIAEIAPKTLGEADDFKDSGKLDGAKKDVHGTVQEGEADAKGPIAATTAKPADPSGITPKPVTPLPPAEQAPPPGDVGAAAAVPKPRPNAEVSLAAGPRQVDAQMSSAGVSEAQLKKSNEPEFHNALGAKSEAQQQSAAAPAAFRTQEQATIAAAHGDAAAEAAKELGAMHAGRGKLLSATVGHQTGAKTMDEQRRAEVSGHIQGIYDKAKDTVEARLKQLDTDVDAAFDAGATAAQQAFENYVDARMRQYKDERYDRIGGSVLWAKDKLVGMPDEVDAFYSEGREAYIKQMDGVLDTVAGIVETGLTEAKAAIATARKDIAAYVDGLEPALKKIGETAAQDISSKLDELESSVNEKQDQLIDTLAQKYNERLQQVDDKIAAMKAENRGLVDAAIDAIGGVIKTIIKLKNMLLDVLSRVADAVSLIIDDPIGFLGNLVSAVKLGVQNFASRFGEHMKKGFMEWLFGAVAQAGIQLPKSFDLKGILSLVLQVLGLTYANFRARAVAILGEKIVAGIETVAEVFTKVATEGPGALWEWIQEKLDVLKSMVIDQIISFITEKVVVAGITWLIGLLNPASAFIKACKAIYDIIMFFVERGSQILALVNAVIDSVTAIAKGSIGGAADMVENALARAIPVAIGFLASLLGVGGISEKIKSVIETVRKPINSAIDWVIIKALALVKAAGKFVSGLFGGKEKQPKEQTEHPPEKQAKIDLGLAQVSQSMAAQETDGKLTREAADKIAIDVKGAHPVFSSLFVRGDGDKWAFFYTASGETKGPEAPKSEEDGVLAVSILDEKPPGGSSIGALKLGKFGYDPTDPRRGMGMGDPKQFEHEVGKALSADLEVPLPKKGKKGVLPESDDTSALTREPKIPIIASDPKLWKEPDYVVTGGGKVEVFEATLDAGFDLGTSEHGKGTSHKRVQLAGTIRGLAQKYPEAPIIFNIVTHKPLSDEIRGILETELRNIRAQFAAAGLTNSVQIIWRS